mgnify:CR=1 FL=1
MALCLLAAPAVAQSPEAEYPGEVKEIVPCETVGSGMRVSNTQGFGYFNSGFLTEEYSNATRTDADGVSHNLSVSVPELDSFQGYRVIDCRSGEFVAIGATSTIRAHHLLATEFLRSKVQDEKPFTLADVRRAAKALYKGRDVKILTLRETEQTCSCEYYTGQ